MNIERCRLRGQLDCTKGSSSPFVRSLRSVCFSNQTFHGRFDEDIEIIVMQTLVRTHSGCVIVSPLGRFTVLSKSELSSRVLRPVLVKDEQKLS